MHLTLSSAKPTFQVRNPCAQRSASCAAWVTKQPSKRRDVRRRLRVVRHARKLPANQPGAVLTRPMTSGVRTLACVTQDALKDGANGTRQSFEGNDVAQTGGKWMCGAANNT